MQDLLNASAGLNLGIDFLPGSFGFDGDAAAAPEVAGTVVWLDAFCANVDRSWRNPNLLRLGRRPVGDRPRRRALLPPRLDRRRHRPRALRRPAVGRRATTCCSARAGDLGGVDARADARSSRRACSPTSWSSVPDVWLEPVPGAETPPTSARGVRRLPDGPARHPPVAPGGRRLNAPSGWPTSTSRCAACRASTARSSSTSASCSTATPPTSCEAAWHVDRDRLARSRPRDSTSTRSATRSPSSTPSAPATPRAGGAAAAPMSQRFGFLKAPRSTVRPARPGARRRHRRPGPPARAAAPPARRLTRPQLTLDRRR